MSEHLPLLKEMFPNKIFLSVDDIAKCMNYSKGHIYNLSSRKELPFKIDGSSDKVQVSIIAMAKYLDSKLEAEEAPVVQEKTISVPELIKPVKRGRPRNSERTRLSFQSSLQVAIIKEEVSYIFGGIQEKIEGMEFNSSEEVSCSSKFDEAKSEFSMMANYAEKYMAHSFMTLKFGTKPKAKLKKDF